jgi:hypothetical protein
MDYSTPLTVPQIKAAIKHSPTKDYFEHLKEVIGSTLWLYNEVGPPTVRVTNKDLADKFKSHYAIGCLRSHLEWSILFQAYEGMEITINRFRKSFGLHIPANSLPFAIIQDVDKENKAFEVSMSQILKIINHDRNSKWEDYTEEDWQDGWNYFIEGYEYNLISEL